MNDDATLISVVNGVDPDSSRFLHLFSIDDASCIKRNAPKAVVNLIFMQHTCFAKRGATETVLMTHQPLHVTETTTSGAVLRDIDVRAAAMKYVECADGLRLLDTWHGTWHIRGIAYTPHGDAIAVTVVNCNGPDHYIITLHYGTGDVLHATKCVYDVREGCCPLGIAFSADGAQLFVADSHNPRVCAFRVMAGMMSPCPDVLCTGDGVYGALSVLCCENGGLVAACCAERKGALETRLLYTNAEGGLERMVALPTQEVALTWYGVDVCYRTWEGSVCIIPDKWSSSLRGAWVAACVVAPCA